MTSDHLYLEQQELEVQAFQQGADRYNANRSRNSPANNGPELQYIQKGMDKLVPALDELKRKVVMGESLKGVKYWGIPLVIVDSERLALLTLSSIYNLSGHTTTGIFKDVASRVLLQVVYETLKHEEKGLVSWIDDHHQDGVKGRHIRLLRKRAENYTKTRWSKEENMIIGATLAGQALEVCEEIEHCMVYTSNRRYSNGMRVKEEVRKAIEQRHSALSILTPMYLPMVVPPQDWTTMWDGGYLLGDNEFSCVSPIIKESLSNGLKREDVTTLGRHLDAVNYLQQTRWTSNMYISDMCADIDINQAGVGRVLGTLPKEIPNRENIDWDDVDQKKEYCDRARPIHDHNRKTVGKRTLFYQLRAISKKYAGRYDPFYFSWQMDFRGRFYPRFCGYDSQGDKLNKAYLKFSVGEPLGEEGYDNLTIHLANCMGYDKVDIPQRIQSVHEREEEIRGWVADPLRQSGWTEEDGPYLLAAAEEWVRATDSDNRASFLNHISCAIDGKCNGLQHLSALARDPVGAYATCLVPSDTPQDIYMAVKHKVDEYIKDTIIRSNLEQIKPELPEKVEPGEVKVLSVEERVLRKRQQDFYAALNWRDNTSRALVKRGAMTWAYGVTKQGIMEQLITDGFLDGIKGNLSVNASYMRDAIYWAVNNVVESARDVMEWLQEVAKTCYDAGLPVRWTNPAGMLVTQEYLSQTEKRVSTVTGRYRIYLADKEKEMLRGKQVNGIAPNFVHSIDAAHMANVVLRLKEEGVRDVHMVHDSFGVHARYIPLLHRVVREEFVKIHERNLLQEFKEEVEKYLGHELPPYPEQGDFDVRRVLESKYAFS